MKLIWTFQFQSENIKSENRNQSFQSNKWKTIENSIFIIIRFAFYLCRIHTRTHQKRRLIIDSMTRWIIDDRSMWENPLMRINVENCFLLSCLADNLRYVHHMIYGSKKKDWNKTAENMLKKARFITVYDVKLWKEKNNTKIV